MILSTSTKTRVNAFSAEMPHKKSKNLPEYVVYPRTFKVYPSKLLSQPTPKIIFNKSYLKIENSNKKLSPLQSNSDYQVYFPYKSSLITEKNSVQKHSSNFPSYSNAKYHQRPESVDGIYSRPAFLEPEVSENNIQNKNILNNSRNNQAEFTQGNYIFPLCRTKKESGFDLSLSPSSLLSEHNLKYSKTPDSFKKNNLIESKNQKTKIKALKKFFVKTRA